MKLLYKFDQKVIGASATELFPLGVYTSDNASDLMAAGTAIAFFIKSAAASGTVTATIEASPDDFTTLFELPFDTLAENGTRAADAISSTVLATAGNYVFIVRQCPALFLRLKVVTGLTSGATLDIWAVSASDASSIG